MRVRFWAGTIPVEVECSETSAASLRAIFAPALFTPDEQPPAELTFFERAKGQVSHEPEGPLLRRYEYTPLFPARVEGEVLSALPRLRASQVCLHAAVVVLAGVTLVFIAQSGGGKSTLTHAALERGAEYLTDDATFVDGSMLYGYARAVRFSPVPVSGPHPAYLRGFDLESHRYGLGPEARVVPLYPGPYRPRRGLDAREQEVVVVGVGRAESDEVVEVDTLERLRLLYQASITSHRVYSGELDRGRTFRLEWSDPARALEALLRRL
jgi:hypothetical protein